MSRAIVLLGALLCIVAAACGGGGSHMTGGAGGTGGGAICGHETYCDVPPDAGTFVPYCADTQNDPENCGACGKLCVTCADASIGYCMCSGGICVAKPPGPMSCESKAGPGHQCVEYLKGLMGMPCPNEYTAVSSCSTSNALGTCTTGTTATTYYQDGGFVAATAQQNCMAMGGVWMA